MVATQVTYYTPPVLAFRTLCMTDQGRKLLTCLPFSYLLYRSLPFNGIFFSSWFATMVLFLYPYLPNATAAWDSVFLSLTLFPSPFAHISFFLLTLFTSTHLLLCFQSLCLSVFFNFFWDLYLLFYLPVPYLTACLTFDLNDLPNLHLAFCVFLPLLLLVCP